MKIKLAVNATSLLSPFTGIGQYTRQLFMEIERQPQIELFYFYGAAWGDKLRDSAFPGIANIKRFIKKLVPSPYAVSRMFQQMRFNAGNRRLRPDLYHEPGFLPFHFDGPCVITVHDLSHIRYPETHPVDRVKIMNELLPDAIRNSARILVDSEFVKQEIISTFGSRPDKIHAVPLGVSGRYRPMAPAETLPCTQRYGLVYSQYLLAASTLEPRKNLVQALEAFKTLPEKVRETHPLVIAGMKGWLTDSLESKMAELERKGQVRLLGYVPNELMPQLYAGATMLLYPSIYEGFGLPPLEAMASGVPVITSNQSSIPEVVGEVGIMVDPYDVQAMTEAITRLIDNPDEKARRSLEGVERARSFTWEKCAKQTLEVYKKALNR